MFYAGYSEAATTLVQLSILKALAQLYVDGASTPVVKDTLTPYLVDVYCVLSACACVCACLRVRARAYVRAFARVFVRACVRACFVCASVCACVCLCVRVRVWSRGFTCHVEYASLSSLFLFRVLFPLFAIVF